MFASIVLKRTIIGKFEAGPRGTSQYQLLRCWLVNELFQKDKVQAVTDLIGRHFELVSCMYRLLGAKVGKRVFWPGTHIKFSGEYDLLEIGDDVVFGSRSTIMCGDRERLAKVRLCAGANVADNCVVLPGATIGKNAVLGAYGLCPADWCLPESSVWFGSKNGEPVMLGRGVTDGHDIVTPMQVSDQNDVASNNFKIVVTKIPI
jgi:carbonic anhydrase/acetyltransferase-like protein (isoleucine patch superfamily)